MDEEHFFQVGDIDGAAIVKSTRPYLSALQDILDAPKEKTIYVIDEPSKVVYTSR
jgi:hypothetical protein